MQPKEKILTPAAVLENIKSNKF